MDKLLAIYYQPPDTESGGEHINGDVQVTRGDVQVTRGDVVSYSRGCISYSLYIISRLI